MTRKYKRSKNSNKSARSNTSQELSDEITRCTHLKNANHTFSIDEFVAKILKSCARCRKSDKIYLCLHQNCLKTFCLFHLSHHIAENLAHNININRESLTVYCSTCKCIIQPTANIPGWSFGDRLLTEENIKRISQQISHLTDSVSTSTCTEDIPLVHKSPVRSNTDWSKSSGYVSSGTRQSARSSIAAPGSMNDTTLSDLSDDEIKEIGLVNLGNTCYMNSALQCLLHCMPFIDYFRDERMLAEFGEVPEFNPTSATRAFRDLVRTRFSNGHNYIVAPKLALHVLQAECAAFRGYQQQDAQEFIRCYLDLIHKELQQIIYAYEQRRETSYQTTATSSQILTSNDSSRRGHSRQASSDSELSFYTADSGNDDCLSSSDLSNEDYFLQNMEMPISPKPGVSTSQDKVIPLTEQMVRIFGTAKQALTRSAVTETFDGRLLSTVKCSTCHAKSRTIETFQDLSLAIPTPDQLAANQETRLKRSLSVSSIDSDKYSDANSSFPSGIVTPTRENSRWSSVFTSPLSFAFNLFISPFQWLSSAVGLTAGRVTLDDCLRSFFMPDDLHGDNMYNCERCKKLRDGVKQCTLLALPEVLCIHLKRFRAYSDFGGFHGASKISTKVSFDVEALDLTDYCDEECRDTVKSYSLVGVVTHMGSADGGHYIAHCRAPDGQWYTFDDTSVYMIEVGELLTREAYILFYTKLEERALARREHVVKIDSQQHLKEKRLHADTITKRVARAHGNPGVLGPLSLVRYYISRAWLARFTTFAEPGPITNHDFLCPHGHIAPQHAPVIHQLYRPISADVWKYYQSQFGGGPVCAGDLSHCHRCSMVYAALMKKRQHEYQSYHEIIQQEQVAFERYRPDSPTARPQRVVIHGQWIKTWDHFVRGHSLPPGAIANDSLLRCSNGEMFLRRNADYFPLFERFFDFLQNSYGGGPKVYHTVGPQPQVTSNDGASDDE